MATTNEKAMMQGLGNNPGLLIRAPDNVCDGATIVENSTYLDGKAVRGEYSGQKLMETGWFDIGVLNNIVLPTLYIEASTPASQDLIDNLVITIYKMDKDGVQLGTTELTVIYQTKMSDRIGQAPNESWVNRQTIQWPWFDIRYKYKFVVSVGSLRPGEYLYLEGMYLQSINNSSVMLFQQEKYGSDSLLTVPIIEGISWTATTGAAATTISAQLLSDVFTGAPGGTSGGQRSLMNAIDAVVTTFATGGTPADTSTYVSNDYAVDTQGGYTVTFDIEGLTAATTYYFYTMVIGYRTPIEV